MMQFVLIYPRSKKTESSSNLSSTRKASGGFCNYARVNNNTVYAIAISGSDVYIRGDFLNAGGNANANRIARWNGSSWNALGSGLNSTVFAIAISGSDVYAGGNFTDGGGNSNADYIARWDGSSWNALGTGLNERVLAIAISGSNVFIGGWFTDAGGNPNADYIARWGEAALPVEWVSFNAKQQAQAVQIAWSVVNQLNNAGWHIEHSTDGEVWARIGWVAGDGDKQEVSKYDFLHTDPANGQNYYRLEQVDTDSESEYSRIVSVKMDGKNVVSVFPNPGSGVFTILGLEKAEDTAFSLTNQVGQTLPFSSANNGQLDLSAFPAGIYFLRVTNSGQVI